MFETLGFENLTTPQAAVWFGLILGVAFGALAEITRFCLRRGLVGAPDERRPALGVWLMALAAAVAGTQAAIQSGLVAFGDHRFFAADLPILAIVAGGLLFGAGMVLTRGCASRMTVLFASGNLRAGIVLLIFAVTAHAMLKGAHRRDGARHRAALGRTATPPRPRHRDRPSRARRLGGYRLRAL